MSDQGFIPGAMLRVPPVRAHVPPAHIPPAPHMQVPASAAHTAQNVARGAVETARSVSPKEEALDQSIARAQTVQNIANKPFALMMPAMLTIPVGWVLGLAKRERSKAIVDGFGDAVIHGSRKTAMNKPLHLFADMMETAGETAQKIGGRAAPMGQSMLERGARWRTGADVWGGRISNFLSPVTKSVGSGLEKIGAHGTLSKAWGRVGKFPLVAAVAAVVATAGMTVTWLSRAKHLSMRERALADLTVLAGAGSPLVAEANKVYSQEQSRTMISAAFESAANAIMVPFEANVNIAGPAFVGLMAGQMTLPMVGQMFVKENPTLDAMASLQAAKRGEIQASPSQQAFWTKQLLAPVTGVAANNNLLSAVALHLVQNNTSMEQLGVILREAGPRNALIKQVGEKMLAAQAGVNGSLTASAPSQSPAVTAGQVTTKVAPATSLDHDASKLSQGGMPAMAGAPVSSIAKADASHHGTVANNALGRM